MAENVREIVKLTHKEWLAKGRELFGANFRDWKFVCPNCDNIQSGRDFHEAGHIASPFADQAYFSCIGRWIEGCKGEFLKNKLSPCNYTNGGLFDFAPLRVVDDSGEEHSAFEFYIGPAPEEPDVKETR